MESKWLEDFITLAQTRSFSRSAQLRHVTQPAFSRRIRALEAWLGADLIDRTTYPTRLTQAGEIFHEQAIGMLASIEESRALVRGQRTATAEEIEFAAPHSLALTWFPRWLTDIERQVGMIRSRVHAANVHDAVMRLVEGQCDLLLCYHHPLQPVQLDAQRYDMLILGHERLAPYARCRRDAVPEFTLPGTAGAPLPYLAYGQGAYLGRVVEAILAGSAQPVFLEKRHETDMAEALKMMALGGHGIAFLPDSAVGEEIRARRLACAGSEWGAQLEIRIYRERPVPGRASRRVVQALWDTLAQEADAKSNRRARRPPGS